MILFTNAEKPIVAAIKAGAVTREEIARTAGLPLTTVNSRLHKLYKRTGALNLENILLRIYPPMTCPPHLANLTEREKQIVQLILNGVARTVSLSTTLKISQKTISQYLTSIYCKTGAANRAELILMIARMEYRS